MQSEEKKQIQNEYLHFCVLQVQAEHLMPIHTILVLLKCSVWTRVVEGQTRILRIRS